MCGLVGVAGDTTRGVKDVFSELLLVNVLRGSHSTGIATVNYDKNRVTVVKAAVPSPSFLGLKCYQDAIKETGTKVIIGHNRYATLGAHTMENAHPFEFESVVGAHNGTIDRWALKDLHNADKYGTDSEAIYSHINEHGLKDAVDVMVGAWALTWYDKKKNTINFLNNGKRPLFYAYSEDRCTLFWASEQLMLDWVMTRNNFKKFNNEFYIVEQNVHTSWEVPKDINSKFKAPRREECKHEYKPLPKTDLYGYGTSDRFGWYTDYNSGNGTADDIPLPPWYTAFDDDPEKFRPPYKDIKGAVIPKKKFIELINSGCLYCTQSTTKWGEYIMPLPADMNGKETYLCKDCFTDPDIRELCKHAI